MQSVFPALTCTAQATFRTASLPCCHGMIANGFFSRSLMKTFFWEQSAALVQGARIWNTYRKRGGKVALLFWQQSLGEEADVIISPAPIHKHHGGIIDQCYSKPAGLYQELCRSIGRKFKLSDYWGPQASADSSKWIAEASSALLEHKEIAPDLCLTYLPALDYDLQRYGPDHPASTRALDSLLEQLSLLISTAEKRDYNLLIYGDYAIGPCPKGPVYPNRALRENGLFAVRRANNRLYPDFAESRAFAVADHEIAHVYVKSSDDLDNTTKVLSSVPGIEKIMDRNALDQAHLLSDHCGDLVITAADGHWLAYPWWTAPNQAPEYATHVDIHNKPGYDPVELFSGWPPGSVSLDCSRVKGSHGKTGQDRKTCWASNFLQADPESCLDLAKCVQQWMDNK